MTLKAAPNTELRNLPSIDELLRTASGAAAARDVGHVAATILARNVVDSLRTEMLAGSGGAQNTLLERAEALLDRLLLEDRLSGTRRVINATGVIIHTNLGRAPLADAAREAMAAAAGYASVEYDILEGKRGRRGSRTERLLAELTGAEDALVVNNCAAAAFFVLSAFAAGGEVVISRGELVEIGGDFRVPDVLTASGATLREVGTTNRTKLSDYELAISSETKLLLRVHPSNYRIVGFTAAPSRREIAALADAKGLLFFEDIGSGALVDLAEYGLADEPKVSDAIADGAHIVSFSGDKLLGGPQCGIIAGRKELIERLRKHPLQRALRADKKTYAALEATLDIYRRGTHFNDVPVLRYLSRSYDEIRTRANSIKEKLSGDLNAEVIDGESVIGGGAAPDIHPRTALLALSHESRSAEQIERKLRMNDPPIIARLSEDRVVIDLRTVEAEEDAILLATLSSL